MSWRRKRSGPKRPGAPDPPRGPGPPYTIRTPLREGLDTPPGGSGAATCPQARARQPSFPWKTCPPTAFDAGGSEVLCRSRARGDFCQAVLLVARYQGAQYSRWHHLRHARQSATPVRHDNSATEYHNGYAVDPTVYAASYIAPTGAPPMGQIKTPLGQRVYRTRKRIREEIPNHCSTISIFPV